MAKSLYKNTVLTHLKTYSVCVSTCLQYIFWKWVLFSKVYLSSMCQLSSLSVSFINKLTKIIWPTTTTPTAVAIFLQHPSQDEFPDLNRTIVSAKIFLSFKSTNTMTQLNPTARANWISRLQARVTLCDHCWWVHSAGDSHCQSSSWCRRWSAGKVETGHTAPRLPVLRLVLADRRRGPSAGEWHLLGGGGDGRQSALSGQLTGLCPGGSRLRRLSGQLPRWHLLAQSHLTEPWW